MNQYLSIKYITLYLCTLMLAACNFSFENDITIDLKYTQPQLVINAKMDNLDSLFSIIVTTSRPIANSGELTELKHLFIQVFEDDRPMLTLDSSNMYPYFFYEQNMVVKPGANYRLEVTADQFPKATASALAPSIPSVSHAHINIDMASTITVQNYASYWNSNNHFSSCYSFFPASIQLNKTTTTEKNYYLIEVQHDGFSEDIAITNRYFLGDNPEIEATGAMTDPAVSIFMFDKFIFSDAFLTNQTTLDFNIGTCQFEPNQYSNNTQLITKGKVHFIVRHINPEIYQYYRTAALQREGLGFFSEPINVVSNITNGYGYFSVTSSLKRIQDI